MLGKPGIDFKVERRAAGKYPAVFMTFPWQPPVYQQEFQRQRVAAFR